jgi:hypothetical protein
MLFDPDVFELKALTPKATLPIPSVFKLKA